jgi:hypothetical protein
VTQFVLFPSLAVEAGALLNWGHVPNCFQLLPGAVHGDLVGIDLFGDLPVRFSTDNCLSIASSSLRALLTVG